MTRFKQYTSLDPTFVQEQLSLFFNEDNINEDITTQSTQDNKSVEATLVAREPLLFAGQAIIKEGFKECIIKSVSQDGEFIESNQTIACFTGPINMILKKERVVLNLLQRLCGVASTTHSLAKITSAHNIELLDTRKTTPGLRLFEKFAVAIGGGTNHRFSLKHAVMIKDNHLMGNPNIIQTIADAKEANPDKDIQIEVDTIEQLEEALKSEATSILLDNFSPESLPDVVKKIRSSVKGEHMYIELSGGIKAETLESFCIPGINGISMGALTHNITSKDIGLDIL